MELLKTGSYREALRLFKEAYALVASPLIFYDFGLAYVGMGDRPRALEAFDRFLAEAPDAPSDKRRKAEHHREELRAWVAIVEVEADVAAAELSVDRQGLGHVAFPRRLYVDPGSHEVVAHEGGATDAATTACLAGQTLTVALHLAAPPAVAVPSAGRATALPTRDGASADESARAAAVAALRSPPPTASAGWARPWAWSAAAVGAVSVGVGIAFGLMARNEGEAVTSESQDRRDFMPNLEAAGMHDQRVETVFLLAGAVAVVAGVGLYAWARHHAGDAPRRETP